MTVFMIAYMSVWSVMVMFSPMSVIMDLITMNMAFMMMMMSYVFVMMTFMDVVMFIMIMAAAALVFDLTRKIQFNNFCGITGAATDHFDPVTFQNIGCSTAYTGCKHYRNSI
jgi:hypothetical protein